MVQITYKQPTWNRLNLAKNRLNVQGYYYTEAEVNNSSMLLLSYRQLPVNFLEAKLGIIVIGFDEKLSQ